MVRGKRDRDNVYCRRFALPRSKDHSHANVLTTANEPLQQRAERRAVLREDEELPILQVFGARVQNRCGSAVRVADDPSVIRQQARSRHRVEQVFPSRYLSPHLVTKPLALDVYPREVSK